MLSVGGACSSASSPSSSAKCAVAFRSFFRARFRAEVETLASLLLASRLAMSPWTSDLSGTSILDGSSDDLGVAERGSGRLAIPPAPVLPCAGGRGRGPGSCGSANFSSSGDSSGTRSCPSPCTPRRSSIAVIAASTRSPGSPLNTISGALPSLEVLFFLISSTPCGHSRL